MKKPAFLGIDTSNYRTSCALVTEDEYFQHRRLLPVEQGKIGLRQSDAVFCHIKMLSELIKELMAGKEDYEIKAIGVSAYPRDCEGSYMPCFLVGKMTAESIGAVLNVPVYFFSHQSGHISAALYSAHCLELFDSPFAAFHLSGGTTECVKVNSLEKGNIEIITSSNDLHAGQVIDRCANMLGLPFPGGEELDRLSLKSSKKFKNKVKLKDGNPCFSGIENQCEKMLRDNEEPCDIARFCIDSLISGIKGMVSYAKTNFDCNEFVFGGGVSANTIIRDELSHSCKAHFASLELSGDNAVGIAYLAKRAFGREV